MWDLLQKWIKYVKLSEIKIMDFVLGVIASLVANVVPAIHDAVERNKTLKEKLYDCLEKAVDQWSATKEVKQSILLDPVRYTSKLNDYIEHPEKGMHPLDKELMQLWVDAIKADGDCSAYILAIKEDLIPTSFNRINLVSKHIKSFIKINKALNELFERAKDKRPQDIIVDIIKGFNIKTLYSGRSNELEKEANEKIERLRDFYVLVKELDDKEKQKNKEKEEKKIKK